MLHWAGAAREAAGRAGWAPGIAPGREARGSAAEPDPNGERRSSPPGEKQRERRRAPSPRTPRSWERKVVEKRRNFVVNGNRELPAGSASHLHAAFVGNAIDPAESFSSTERRLILRLSVCALWNSVAFLKVLLSLKTIYFLLSFSFMGTLRFLTW